LSIQDIHKSTKTNALAVEIARRYQAYSKECAEIGVGPGCFSNWLVERINPAKRTVCVVCEAHRHFRNFIRDNIPPSDIERLTAGSVTLLNGTTYRLTLMEPHYHGLTVDEAIYYGPSPMKDSCAVVLDGLKKYISERK